MDDMSAAKSPRVRDPCGVAFHVMRQILQEHAALWKARIPELTKPQMVVLAAVTLNPGIDQVTTARIALVDTATMAGVVLRLEQRGLIARDADPEDRRRYLLRLADEGHATFRAVAKTAEELDDELMARLEPDEQRQLLTLLTKLATPLS